MALETTIVVRASSSAGKSTAGSRLSNVTLKLVETMPRSRKRWPDGPPGPVRRESWRDRREPGDDDGDRRDPDQEGFTRHTSPRPARSPAASRGTASDT